MRLGTVHVPSTPPPNHRMLPTAADAMVGRRGRSGAVCGSRGYTVIDDHEGRRAGPVPVETAESRKVVPKTEQSALSPTAGRNAMHDLKWSKRERKIARRAFEAALQQELGEIVTKFKEMAARAEKPDDMWAVESWLAQQRHGIDTKYDFRYSQLVIIFGTLLRESRVTEQQLEGLGEDKLSYIVRIATL